MLDASAGAAGTLDDTGRLAQDLPSIAALGRSVSRYAGPVATTLSAVEVARDIQSGNYLDSGFSATDTAISYVLADAGPVGIGVDGAFITAGGTQAAARLTARIGCAVGSYFSGH